VITAEFSVLLAFSQSCEKSRRPSGRDIARSASQKVGLFVQEGVIGVNQIDEGAIFSITRRRSSG
jgi:hypothetical protein